MAIKPVTDALWRAAGQGVQGLMGAVLPFADGGAFAQGRVMPFARGGVVSSPDDVPDAGRARADGRGGAGGDHAAGARGRTGGWACGRRAAGGR